MIDDEFSVYTTLANDTDDQRWAFGTGFVDSLSGTDMPVPAGVDGSALARYSLMLGDDAVVYSHRLQQWVTRAPELEEETALANIALDLLGQARMLFSRAGAADGSARTEDDYAFFRTENEFRNVRLVEHADADFAELVARLLVFATWRLALFTALTTSKDPVLAAIAAKGAPELTYHRDYAAQWVVRLGDGTDLSHGKMQAGIDVVWPLLDELFDPHPVEASLPEIAVAGRAVRGEVDEVLGAVLAAAHLRRPDVVVPLARLGGRAGRDGAHTEALGYLLAEMQSVARAHPGASW